MATINHAKARGYRQGRRERLGLSPMLPCPYPQWPVRYLRRYSAWVSGWALGRGFH